MTTNDDLQRWLFLAERASVVGQLSTVVDGETEESHLVQEDGTVLASGMTWEDGAFHAEARRAVVALVQEVMTMRDYVDYVKDVVALAEQMSDPVQRAMMVPMTFEAWLESQEEGESDEQ